MSLTSSAKVFDITPRGSDSSDPAYVTQSFGVAYRERYAITEAVADLNMALVQSDGGLELSADDGSGTVFQILKGGPSPDYKSKYEMTEADISKEIERFTNARDATLENDHVARSFFSHKVAMAYQAKSQKTGRLEDLENSIQQFRAALDSGPEHDMFRPYQLLNIGVAYRKKYQHTEEPTDLDLAISFLEACVDETPHEDGDRRWRLEELGVTHWYRFKETNKDNHLSSAIQRVQEAVQIDSDYYPDRTRQLRSLGSLLRERYQRSRDGTDQQLAIQCFNEGLREGRAAPIERWRAGRALVRLQGEAGNWSLAYEAAHACVDQIPRVLSRGLQVSDKQNLVTALDDFSLEAAAVAMMAGQPPYEAIRLIELGRGLTLGSLGEMRTDISQLQDKFPELGSRYEELRDQLAVPAVSGQFEAYQRLEASNRLDKMIQEIRGLPGFDQFLLAPSENDLKKAAAYGPIVIVNVHDYRCDAFIIESHQIRSLALTDLRHSDIQTREAMLGGQLDRESLRWLWDTIANPVLTCLGLTHNIEENWPRLWWIPTGALAKFPIHAAGEYYEDCKNSVLDRVNSSYSVSVQMLLRSRQYRQKSMAPEILNTTVLVGMEKTPGFNNLQFAKREIEEVERLCLSKGHVVKKPLPCQPDVLSAIKGCRIFHFAGHGATDQLDPLKSALILHNDKLTVASILQENMSRDRPYLAYLSACGTGQVRHEGLVNEGIHLISAFQLAGFVHAIGSLWQVDDSVCVRMSILVYRWLLGHNRSPDSVSAALHHATRTSRDQWISENHEVLQRGIQSQMKQKNTNDLDGTSRDIDRVDDTPLYWVPYVHFGV
ncbi:unnamed protein product [Clonostachys rhizophaga]|uniref:CHAT domain-containing protein n=1 Tax=Clonostachys rhizophaga TaxID=160324 RepID=A0A9N9YTY2_9HYPO|nr:unnamed protein product [Clonostachys rhizophaga]